MASTVHNVKDGATSEKRMLLIHMTETGLVVSVNGNDETICIDVNDSMIKIAVCDGHGSQNVHTAHLDLDSGNVPS